MPDMDGYQVCERLKASPETQHIPVIFVTAMDGVEDESKGFALGAVECQHGIRSRCTLSLPFSLFVRLMQASNALYGAYDFIVVQRRFTAYPVPAQQQLHHHIGVDTVPEQVASQ